MGKPPGIPNELFAYERMKRHWTQGDVADNIGAPDVKTIGRWERGEVAPSPYYQGKLAEIFGKSARALGFPPDGQIPFWHVPYRRNAFFTGRDETLQLLRDTFLAQHASSVPRLPLALSGLGGVGKSQIALEYAYRYREHYHTVLWLHAASDQDLVANVTAVVDLLDLPGKDTANPAQLIEAFKEWLTQLTRWLLIFDNVEHLQLLAGFLPAEITGHLLLTTRSQNTGTHAQRIAVEPMDNNTGAELLLRRAKFIPLESTLAHMAAADAATACSLSEDMGGLPLAIDQAGAYIEETAVSLPEYVKRYQKERRDLLHRRGALASNDGEHPEPVAVSLGLSIDSAGERYPLAGDILRFCAFLHPDAIPEELFQHDDSFKFGTTAFDNGIEVLLRYSLIRRNTQDQTFSMHRLVQAVLIDDMPTDLQKQWRERVIHAVIAVFPRVVEFKTWRQCERLLSHALICATWTKGDFTPTVEVANLLSKTGIYLYRRGQYSDAETLLARSLSIYEQLLGVDHPQSSPTLDALGNLYFIQGKFEKAEPLLVRVHSILVKHLGTEHPITVKSLLDLAANYVSLGKFSYAEPLYEQALTNQEKQSGAEHPENAWGLTVLASSYLLQGKFSYAEPLYERAIAIRDKRLETEHPDNAHNIFGLARIYHEQGKYNQAEFLYRRALRIWHKHLGAEHSLIAPPLHRLGMLMQAQGRHEQAKALYERALRIQEQYFDASHPYTQQIKKDYAKLLNIIGYEAEATALEANDGPSV